jgi:hypothetical protein
VKLLGQVGDGRTAAGDLLAGAFRSRGEGDTFAGIAPSSVALFIGAQLVGAAVAVLALPGLYPDITEQQAADVVLPHAASEPSAARD